MHARAAATDVIAAMTLPSAARCSACARPRCARRALSNSANVRYASKTEWLTSEGSKTMSMGKGRFFSGRNDHIGRSPAFFSRRTVANASAPTSSEKSRSPALIARAASTASTWGTDPPIPE